MPMQVEGGGKGLALGVGGQRHASAALPPEERLGTYCTGGWLGLAAGLHGHGKSRPHRDWNPGTSSP
jgi:hypothetical protein